MKKILTLAALALSLLTASAGVLIYRTVERVKTVGGGAEGTLNYGGDWIINPDSGDASIIRWYTWNGQKLYRTNSMPHMLFTRVNGKGRSFSVLAFGGTVGDFTYNGQPWVLNVHAEGQNKSVTIASNATASYPRTMKGSVVEIGPEGDTVLDLGSILNFSYQQSMTVTNNDAENDAQTILNAIASQLQSEGYQPAN
jgi:hypothetical protein